MPRNILKIFGKLDPGGAELRTLELIRALKNIKQDYRFHILVLSGKKGELDKLFTDLDVNIHYMKLKSITFLYDFYKLLKKEKIDTVYSNVFLFSGFFMLYAKILKVPYRFTHIRTLYDEKRSLIRKYRNELLKVLIKYCSTRIIGVNEAVLLENFGKSIYHDKKYKVLYNGISIKPTSFTKEERDKRKDKGKGIHIIHIGRQTKAKNHTKLIRIFCEINEKIPNSYLHLIGKKDKKIQSEIEIILSEKELHHNVINWDVQKDISLHLESKDVMIFPSQREGLPGVVLEAMAMGVPVVASDIPPHRELTRYFSYIRLVSLDKNEDEWVDEVIKAVEANTINMNEKIVEEFQNSPFHMHNHVDKYLEIIEGN